VPWIKGNGQRGFNDEDIPKDQQKRLLYEIGKKSLFENEYYEIGMDHFALKNDSLYKAFENGNLHRNFMGYNSSKTQLMIGLGVSSISDSWYSFAQNTKNLEDYFEQLESNKLPIYRGHLLTSEDLVIRKHILNLMCQFETSWENSDAYFEEIVMVLEDLEEMKIDGLIQFEANKLIVTEAGKPFVRNICMAFDLRLKRNSPNTQLFSMTI
jgi:oxygen-independent coproporphyrinogen-3 oxidase